MPGNTVVLEFAGDATKLAKETQKANKDVESFGKAAEKASKDVSEAAKTNDDYVDRMGKMGLAVDGATAAIDSIGTTTQAFADIQDSARQKVQKHERALLDVRQAQEDYNQALQDGKQAAIDSGQAEIDLEQAKLDQKTSLQAYNEAVREHGKNSEEAMQAAIDLKQADQDVIQAQADTDQALRDQTQSAIDAKDAQLNLNDAQKEADPSELQKAADTVERYSPLLEGLVFVMGLVAAAQWAWNAAQLASPMTWIILAIAAIVAIIVLLVMHWDKVKEAAGKAWGWIKDKASDFWNFLKKIPGYISDAFKKVAGFITAPFRAAFNFVADAWNNTIGRLRWSVPDWIPGIGGNTISVPQLPKFHQGGTVPGAPGSEMLAILQAGETITPANSNHSEPISVTVMLDGEVLMRSVGNAIKRNGGNAQVVLVGNHG